MRAIRYDAMTAHLAALEERYSFVSLEAIGRSVMGRPIWALRIGEGPLEMHCNGAHHAREWITTLMLVRAARDIARHIDAGRELAGWDVRRLFRRVSLWMVPMVNPDGVELCLGGLPAEHPLHQELVRMNRGSTDFSRWKANIRGVDLNLQYRAGWSRGRAFCCRRPGPAFYPGPAPESEPEARALADHTRRRDFQVVLAYHSQGEVLYWRYRGYAPPGSRTLVRELSRLSGYRPATESRRTRYVHGGYKDWFVYTFRRPGFTVEVGRGTSPVPLNQFADIYRRNLPVLLRVAHVLAAGEIGGAGWRWRSFCP